MAVGTGRGARLVEAPPHEPLIEHGASSPQPSPPQVCGREGVERGRPKNEMRAPSSQLKSGKPPPKKDGLIARNQDNGGVPNRMAVINVVGLTGSLIGPDMPNIARFRDQGALTRIQPAFPA